SANDCARQNASGSEPQLNASGAGADDLSRQDAADAKPEYHRGRAKPYDSATRFGSDARTGFSRDTGCTAARLSASRPENKLASAAHIAHAAGRCAGALATHP